MNGIFYIFFLQCLQNYNPLQFEFVIFQKLNSHMCRVATTCRSTALESPSTLTNHQNSPSLRKPQNVFVDVKLPVPGCIQIEAGQPLLGRNIVNKNCQKNVWVRKALKSLAGPEFCDAIILRNEIWKYEFGKNLHSSHATSCHYYLIGGLLLLYF